MPPNPRRVADHRPLPHPSPAEARPETEDAPGYFTRFLFLYIRHVEPKGDDEPEPLTPAIRRRLWELICAAYADYTLMHCWSDAVRVASCWMPRLRHVCPEQFSAERVEQKYRDAAQKFYESLVAKHHFYAADQYLADHSFLTRSPDHPERTDP